MFPEKELTGNIIGAAVEVHKELGPGLLETVYQMCLAQELTFRGISFEQEKPLTVKYKNVLIDSAYRLDFIVSGKVVVELKSVDDLLPVHEAQILTYLKLTSCRIGLLINFNVPVLTRGIRRFAL
jgi:GxxExxY protein